MDRAAVASLPEWERAILLAGGRSILGIDEGDGQPSEADILSTPGVGW